MKLIKYKSELSCENGIPEVIPVTGIRMAPLMIIDEAEGLSQDLVDFIKPGDLSILPLPASFLVGTEGSINNYDKQKSHERDSHEVKNK